MTGTDILDDKELIVAGDRIFVRSTRDARAAIAFKIYSESTGGGADTQSADNAASGDDRRSAERELIDVLRDLYGGGPGRTSGAGSGFGGGSLHKALHKGLHKALHKRLHKALHKSPIGVTTAGSAYAVAAGFSWPSIEVPWRELKKLDKNRKRYQWDDQEIEPPPGIDQIVVELGYLRDKQRELRRPEQAYRRARIEVEASNDLTAYMLPLGADASSPSSQTAVMFQTILWLGSLIGQFYKARYESPRPHVLDPSIEPYIPVPVYSSYPSNHAFQSFLIAEVFSRAVPEHPGVPALFEAAWEVAVNREWAGLHIRSDTVAGKKLARLCAPALEDALSEQIRQVRKEWLGDGGTA